MLTKSPNPGTRMSVGVRGGEVRDAWSSEVRFGWEGLSKEPPTKNSKFRGEGDCEGRSGRTIGRIQASVSQRGPTGRPSPGRGWVVYWQWSRVGQKKLGQAALLSRGTSRTLRVSGDKGTTSTSGWRVVRCRPGAGGRAVRGWG